MPDTKRPVAPLDFTSIVLVVAGALLLVAGVIYALALAAEQNISGDQKFRLIGQAASSVVGILTLGGVALAVHERRLPAEERTLVASSVAIALGIGTALATILIALNGVVVDLTQDAPGGIRLSNLIGRVVTILVAGLALMAAALAPTGPRPLGNRADATRPPSLPDDPDPASPA